MRKLHATILAVLASAGAVWFYLAQGTAPETEEGRTPAAAATRGEATSARGTNGTQQQHDSILEEVFARGRRKARAQRHAAGLEASPGHAEQAAAAHADAGLPPPSVDEPAPLAPVEQTAAFRGLSDEGRELVVTYQHLAKVLQDKDVPCETLANRIEKEVVASAKPGGRGASAAGAPSNEHLRRALGDTLESLRQGLRSNLARCFEETRLHDAMKHLAELHRPD